MKNLAEMHQRLLDAGLSVVSLEDRPNGITAIWSTPPSEAETARATALIAYYDTSRHAVVPNPQATLGHTVRSDRQEIKPLWQPVTTRNT